MNILSDATIGTLLIIGSVLCDVLSNIYLKKSQGFKHKLYGIIAITFVGLAFLCLAMAISVMDLSIAYALFGAFGLLLTTIIDRILFWSAYKTIRIFGAWHYDFRHCNDKNDLTKIATIFSLIKLFR